MDSSEKIDLHAEPVARPRRWTAHWLALGIGGLPALATVLAFGGSWYWQLDLLSHFRVQYAVVLVIMALLAAFMRRWRLALVVMIPLAINIGVILPLYVHPKWLAPQHEFISQQNMGMPLQIMSYNMGGMFGTGDEPMEMIRNSKADLIVLQNVHPKTLDRLEFAVAPFRVFLADARNDGYGVALLLRVAIRPQLTIEEAKLIHLTNADSPQDPYAIEAHLRWQGRRLMLLTLKTASPLDRHIATTQAQQFKGIVHWVQQQRHPVIVIGDLSTSPWSHSFAQLLQDTQLQNSQLGFGVQGTWPSTGGAIGQIPVDHCLISPSFVTIKRQLGPSYTSDHHALVVSLQWAGGANDVAIPIDIEDNSPDAEHRSMHRLWRRLRNPQSDHRGPPDHWDHHVPPSPPAPALLQEQATPQEKATPTASPAPKASPAPVKPEPTQPQPAAKPAPPAPATVPTTPSPTTKPSTKPATSPTTSPAT